MENNFKKRLLCSFIFLVILICFSSLVNAGDVTGNAGFLAFDTGFDQNQGYYGAGFGASVNPYSGSLIISETDASLIGRAGFSLSVGRTYNSGSVKRFRHDGAPYTTKHGSWVGLGWNMHLGRIVFPYNDDSSDKGIFYEDPSGARQNLLYDSVGTFSGGEYLTCSQECTENWECDMGYVCFDGECVKYPDCEDDDDCNEGYGCVGETCLQRCQIDEDCCDVSGYECCDVNDYCEYKNYCLKPPSSFNCYHEDSRLLLPDNSRVIWNNCLWGRPISMFTDSDSFTMIKPDGTKYYFRHWVIVDGDWGELDELDPNLREKTYLGVYVTRIEDRNGNAVNIQYYGEQTDQDPCNFDLTYGSPYIERITYEGDADKYIYFHLIYHDAGDPMTGLLDYTEYPGYNGEIIRVNYDYEEPIDYVAGSSFRPLLTKVTLEKSNENQIFPAKSYGYNGAFLLDSITSPLGGTSSYNYKSDFGVTVYVSVAENQERFYYVVDDYTISDGTSNYFYDYEYEDILIGDALYPYYNRKTTIEGPDEHGDETGNRKKIVNTYFSFPNVQRDDFKNGLLLSSETYESWEGAVPDDEILLIKEDYFYGSMIDSGGIKYAACDTEETTVCSGRPCCYQGTPLSFSGSAMQTWYSWPVKQGVLVENYELEDYGDDGERDKFVTFTEFLLGDDGSDYGYDNYGNVRTIKNYGEVTSVEKTYTNMYTLEGDIIYNGDVTTDNIKTNIEYIHDVEPKYLGIYGGSMWRPEIYFPRLLKTKTISNYNFDGEKQTSQIEYDDNDPIESLTLRAGNPTREESMEGSEVSWTEYQYDFEADAPQSGCDYVYGHVTNTNINGHAMVFTYPNEGSKGCYFPSSSSIQINHPGLSYGYNLVKYTDYDEYTGKLESAVLTRSSSGLPSKKIVNNYDLLGRLIRTKKQINDAGDTEVMGEVYYDDCQSGVDFDEQLTNQLCESDDPIKIKLSKKRDSSNWIEPLYYLYDGMGRKVREAQKDDPSISDDYIVKDTSYDEQGNVLEITKPYKVDVLNPGGVASSDIFGQIKKLFGVNSVGSEASEYSIRYDDYDERGRILLETPITGERTYKYREDSVEVKDEKNNLFETIYDAYGRKVEIINAKGTLEETHTTHVYDSVGNIESTINAENQVLGTEYELGRLKDISHEADFHYTYTHYDDGSVKTKKDYRVDHLGDPIVLNYEYDNLGRITVENNVRYYYDDVNHGVPGECLVSAGFGELTRVEDELGEVELYYDCNGRLRKEERIFSGTHFDGPFITLYEYDDADNLITLTNPGEEVVRNQINNLNQVDEVSIDGVAVPIVSNVHYTDSGMIDDMLFGNNILTDYGYTGRDYLETLEITQDSDILHNRIYGYDEVGNVLTETGKDIVGGVDVNLAYGYGDLYRLETVDDIDNTYYGDDFTYTYDLLGNRESITAFGETDIYSYPGYHSNKLGSDGNFNYAYDVAGNMVTKTGDYELENKGFEREDIQYNTHFGFPYRGDIYFGGEEGRWAVTTSESDNRISLSIDSHSGSNSIRINDDNDGSSGGTKTFAVSQIMKAIPNQSYNCSAWAKVDYYEEWSGGCNPSHNSCDGYQDLYLGFLDVNKKHLSYGEFEYDTADSGSWEQISVTKVAPLDASYVICFTNSQGYDIGITLWDDFDLTPTENYITNYDYSDEGMLTKIRDHSDNVLVEYLYDYGGRLGKKLEGNFGTLPFYFGSNVIYEKYAGYKCSSGDNIFFDVFDEDTCNLDGGCFGKEIFDSNCGELNQCVYDESIYNSGSVEDVDSDDTSYAICQNGIWTDIDQTDASACDQVNGVWGVCKNWYLVNAGDYNDFSTTAECCGDDSGEVWITEGDGAPGCCYEGDDYIDSSGECKGYNPCGNGNIDPGEQCDGKDFGGLSCQSYGCDDGILTCTSNCKINTGTCFECSGGGGGAGGSCSPLIIKRCTNYADPNN